MKEGDAQYQQREPGNSFKRLLGSRSFFLKAGVGASLAIVTTFAFENPIRAAMAREVGRMQAVCAFTGTHGPRPHRKTPESEDGLIMRILTPPKLTADKLPVIVWLHPAGVEDAASQEIALVNRGFVVVTLTPREKDLAGNQADQSSHHCLQKDSATALKWVDRNIAAYGGDPKRVAIFDELAK